MEQAMHPDTIIMLARQHQDDLHREVQRDRLARIARETVTAYRNRREALRRREDTGVPVTNPLSGTTPPRVLVHEPAV
jgi:hypothetical protein